MILGVVLKHSLHIFLQASVFARTPECGALCVGVRRAETWQISASASNHSDRIVHPLADASREKGGGGEGRDRISQEIGSVSKLTNKVCMLGERE